MSILPSQECLQLQERQENLLSSLALLESCLRSFEAYDSQKTRENVLHWRQEVIDRKISKLNKMLEDRLQGRAQRMEAVQPPAQDLETIDFSGSTKKRASTRENGIALENPSVNIQDGRMLNVAERTCQPEKSNTCSADKGLSVEDRLTTILKAGGATNFQFKRVPANYYELSMEARRDLLGAPSVDHLFKSIVMVNTQAAADVVDCSNRLNSKYYVVVIQYTTRLNAEKVRNFVYSLMEGKIPKKRYNMRLAPEAESDALTGFQHNAVTPVGMRTDIPVIVSEAVTKLTPQFFWMGGGEVDLKLGMQVPDFMNHVKPFICDCVY